MSQYLLIFLAGLAGSMHCVGMCGGFACALGGGGGGRVIAVTRHLIYNLGRVTSYCFLGALSGYLGLLAIGHDGADSWFGLAQRTLAVGAGVLMLYFGFHFLGLLPSPTWRLAESGWLADGLRQLMRLPGYGAPLALGVFNGLLPCPLVYAFVAQAAGGGGPLPGVLVMAAFGLGTFPAMLLAGGVGSWLSVRRFWSGAAQEGVMPLLRLGQSVRVDWRRYGVRVAGLFIVLLGVITVARGVLPMGVHVHGMGAEL